MRPIRMPAVLLMVLCMALLSGCGKSAPSRFYLLEPVMLDAGQLPRAGNDRCTVIGVGPVSIPAYLDRQQMVTRLSPNRLDLADFDKWAEPLEENLSRVCAQNLEKELCTKAVAIFPWRSARDVDVQVVMDILRLDGSLGQQASLHVRWQLLDGQGRILQTERSHYSTSVQAETYEALALALSSLVQEHSRDIGQAIVQFMD